MVFQRTKSKIPGRVTNLWFRIQIDHMKLYYNAKNHFPNRYPYLIIKLQTFSKTFPLGATGAPLKKNWSTGDTHSIKFIILSISCYLIYENFHWFASNFTWSYVISNALYSIVRDISFFLRSNLSLPRLYQKYIMSIKYIIKIVAVI